MQRERAGNHTDDLRTRRVTVVDPDIHTVPGVEGVLTYRKSADSTRVNWPAVALAYRALLAASVADAELDAVITVHSETKTGPRTLRLSKEME